MLKDLTIVIWVKIVGGRRIGREKGEVEKGILIPTKPCHEERQKKKPTAMI